MTKFFKFGLIVTGKGEAEFLPELLRPLCSAGNCHFRVLARVGQLSPRTSPRRVLHTVGSARPIPTKDVEQIGMPARRHVQSGDDAFVLVVDDLESDRREARPQVFQRYREALDSPLGPHYARAAVHFLVNMLEAYYFADVEALRHVLGLALPEHDGDVEEIRHPKRELKLLVEGFDERRDGARIVARLDLERVLSRPSTCASLRTLVAWCFKQMGQPRGDRFCLGSGIYDRVTGRQLSDSQRSLAVP